MTQPASRRTTRNHLPLLNMWNEAMLHWIRVRDASGEYSQDAQQARWAAERHWWRFKKYVNARRKAR